MNLKEDTPPIPKGTDGAKRKGQGSGKQGWLESMRTVQLQDDSTGGALCGE